MPGGTHGPMTDRQKSLLISMLQQSTFTNREIVKATGCCRRTVQYYRKKLEKGTEIRISPTVGNVKPRIIIHGGAGDISHENVPPERLAKFRESMVKVMRSALVELSKPTVTALDAACHVVATMEDDELFNCGKGAVFTRAGTIELEASVMVSNGLRKRGVGAMMLQHVKNPVLLAREMLVRGEEADGGGAYNHCQLSGQELEDLAEDWGMQIVSEDYFWTRRRWDEHRRGLERESELDDGEVEVWKGRAKRRHQCKEGGKLWCGQCWRKGARAESNKETERKMEAGTYGEGWDGKEYLPQGTVGAVVLDRFGTIAVATSTGGLTNKLPGRIGDTPSLGAGFWAEEWQDEVEEPPRLEMSYEAPPPPQPPMLPAFDQFSRGPDILGLISDCLPTSSQPAPPRQSERPRKEKQSKPKKVRCAVGMSGTGNGDSFIRLNAVRTAAAMSRFSTPRASLAESITKMAGPDGELQKSAADRFGKTGEGEGGIIGIEVRDQESRLVWDFNCGGMFRVFMDDEDREIFGCFRDDEAPAST